MAAVNSLSILELTRVVPAEPNSPNSATTGPDDVFLPLTFFDTFWFKFPPVERLFFYQLTESTSSSPHYFNSVILPNLKYSLSLALLHYLPLAGNLTWPPHDPKPTIHYSPGDGVSVTVAESKAEFSNLYGDEAHPTVDFRPLVPELLTSDDKAEIIAIQITFFPSQGFCIGITSHHAILDGRSSTMFMKAWACLCKQVSDNKENPFSSFSLPEELTPVFDRDMITDPTGIDMIYLNSWFDFTGSGSDSNKRSLKVLSQVGSDVSKFVRATFELKREDIKNLREWVCENELEESKSLHLSTFVLTYAYVSSCLVKTTARDEKDKDVVFAFTADYRTRSDPPVPLNYIGNCVGAYYMDAKSRDLTAENGLAFLVKKLSDVIKGFENRGVRHGLEEMFVKLVRLIKQIEAGKALGIGVAGSIRFYAYGSDFGWGRPKKVEIVSIDRSGAFSLAESRNGGGGGAEIGVVLEKKEMEVFGSLFVNGLREFPIVPKLSFYYYYYYY